MKISEIISKSTPSLSFEVFPPKTSVTYESVAKAATDIASLSPDFMSVTYGAGGGTSDYTIRIASAVKACGVTPLAHLTCFSSAKQTVTEQLDKLRAAGIENILALRGDAPKDAPRAVSDYRYASELVSQIRDYGGFCIGGACYPESHPESESGELDIQHLKHKVECGCSFLTTQMFFDNDIYYNFLFRLMRAGVNCPVIAGIMPVTNASSIKRICSISGTSLPQRFIRIVEKYGQNPEAMKQAGIAYATEQIIDLFANGVNAVHVYSMNKPDVAKAIRDNLSEIVQ